MEFADEDLVRIEEACRKQAMREGEFREELIRIAEEIAMARRDRARRGPCCRYCED
jgi:hypothetical protein